MNLELINKLQNLADTYEVFSFTQQDPSQFLRWYDLTVNSTNLNKGDRPLQQIANVECASFIAAMLSFGNRKQFIPKISQILNLADTFGGISNWLMEGAPEFPHGEYKFYRFYSYDDMHCLFSEMAEILLKNNSLGEYFKTLWKSKETCFFPLLDQLISAAFPKSSIVPKGKNSANKRIQMFLRWMVRQNSPVDLGLWDWYSAADLIIPLDVHVMQEATKLGLIAENSTANRKTAILITKELSQAFPGDPTRGDFALFGLGVSQK